MSEKKPMHTQLGIRIGNESVELQWGESVIKLGLTERGLPNLNELATRERPENFVKMWEII